MPLPKDHDSSRPAEPILNYVWNVNTLSWERMTQPVVAVDEVTVANLSEILTEFRVISELLKDGLNVNADLDELRQDAEDDLKQ